MKQEEVDILHYLLQPKTFWSPPPPPLFRQTKLKRKRKRREGDSARSAPLPLILLLFTAPNMPTSRLRPRAYPPVYLWRLYTREAAASTWLPPSLVCSTPVCTAVMRANELGRVLLSSHLLASYPKRKRESELRPEREQAERGERTKREHRSAHLCIDLPTHPNGHPRLACKLCRNARRLL